MISTNEMHVLDIGMSNFDMEIDEGFAEALMDEPGKVMGGHAAWNFHGRVYFNEGLFHEEVWVYGSPKETISAKTLEELMRDVNDIYGCD